MAFIISRAWSVILAPFAVVKLEQFYEKLQLGNGAKAKILNKQQKYFAIHTSFATNLDKRTKKDPWSIVFTPFAILRQE